MLRPSSPFVQCSEVLATLGDPRKKASPSTIAYSKFDLLRLINYNLFEVNNYVLTDSALSGGDDSLL